MATNAPVLVRHRVVDAQGDTSAYSVRCRIEESVLIEAEARTPVDSPFPDEVCHPVDLEYERTDLSMLSGGRALLLRATPKILSGASDVLDQTPGAVLVVARRLLNVPDITERLPQLREWGFQIALGDYVGDPAQEALLDVCDAVMVESSDRTAQIIADLDGRAQTIVDSVNTKAALDAAFAAGADLVCRTWTLTDVPRAPGELNADEVQSLQLLNLLDNQPMNQEAIVDLVGSSPELSVQALRLVNSSAAALRHRVDSVRQATVLAGPRRLRTIAIAALTHGERSCVDDLWAVLARAVAVAELTGKETGYTAGLLSGLADQRNFPIEWLVEQSGVSPQVEAALISGSGVMGAAIAAVTAVENAEPDRSMEVGLEPWAVSRSWLAGLAESWKIASALSD